VYLTCTLLVPDVDGASQGNCAGVSPGVVEFHVQHVWHMHAAAGEQVGQGCGVRDGDEQKRDLILCQKRPNSVKRDLSVNRDLIPCQKRPNTVSKET